LEKIVRKPQGDFFDSYCRPTVLLVETRSCDVSRCRKCIQCMAFEGIIINMHFWNRNSTIIFIKKKHLLCQVGLTTD